MELTEFAKEMMLMKLTPLQEKLVEAIGDKNNVVEYNRLCGKNYITNEFSCHTLKNMELGQTFGLATPEGVKIFELTEVYK